MKQPQVTEAPSEGRIRLKDLLNEGMESSGEHLADIALNSMPENSDALQNVAANDEATIPEVSPEKAMDIQPAANNDDVIDSHEPTLVAEELHAEVIQQEQAPIAVEVKAEDPVIVHNIYKENQPIETKITPVKEWLNKEKEKAQAASEKTAEVVFQDAKEEKVTVSDDVLPIEDSPKNELLENLKLEDKVRSDEEEAAHDEPAMELIEELPSEVAENQAEDVVEEENSGYKIEGSVKVSGETGKIIIEKISEEDAAKIKAARTEITPPKEIEKPKSVYDEMGFPKNIGFQRPQDILKNWVRFSQLQLGVMDAMNLQLKKIATSASGNNRVNESLNNLVEATRTQCADLDNIADLAKNLNVNDKNISLSDTLSIVTKFIDDAKANVNLISQKAVTMVDKMADAQSNLSVMRAFVGSLQRITKQTNLLAINASIEAAHAGDGGAGFDAVSGELRDLSDEMAKLSEEMHGKIGKVIEDFSDSYAILNEFANINTVENIDKEEIEAVISSVLKQNDKIEKLLYNNAEISRKNSDAISIIAEDMSSYDNSNRHIEDVAGVLEVIISNTYKHKMDALKSLGIDISNADIEKDIVDKMLDGISLEQVKKEFINFLVAEGYI